MREAAYCGDEDVRSEAIALMCSTLKKAGMGYLDQAADKPVFLVGENMGFNP